MHVKARRPPFLRNDRLRQQKRPVGDTANARHDPVKRLNKPVGDDFDRRSGRDDAAVPHGHDFVGGHRRKVDVMQNGQNPAAGVGVLTRDS
jgi:hypothetical protein